MEWNAKWDWENFGVYGTKAIESPKKTDWGIIDDGGSLNGSSAKSSISASTDSSTKDGMRTIEGSGSGSGSFSKGMDSSSLLGLKLGKRTYFENIGGGGGVKLCEMPTPSTITVKKTKSSGQNGPPICCQVEGCNIDLSKAKEYHRKHRVCESHSKCPKVVVGGRERRFCQQCSRFHSVSEFDEKKRSCRRRLSDHNARRRKPQQETIQFDPTRHATSYYGGNQEMSFVFNNSSPLRTPGNCGWDDGACNSKFTLTQGYSFKSNGDAGATDQQLHIKAPQGTINMQNTAANGLENSTTPLVSNPGTKGSLISSLSAAAPEFGRALSLLSSNSWDSCEPESIPLHHQMHQSDIQPMIHANAAIPQGVPLSSSDFWLTGQQHSIHPHVPTNANFQEIRLSKTPYDTNFYSNILK